MSVCGTALILRRNRGSVKSSMRTPSARRRPVTVIVNPIGEYLSPATEVGHRDTLTDREYVINVRTYDGNGTQIISAKLKLTVIPDEGYPWSEIYSPPYSQNQERSRFLVNRAHRV